MLKDFLAFQHFSTYFSTSWTVDIYFPPTIGDLAPCQPVQNFWDDLEYSSDEGDESYAPEREEDRVWQGWPLVVATVATCKWHQHSWSFLPVFGDQDDEDIDSGVRSPIGWRSWFLDVCEMGFVWEYIEWCVFFWGGTFLPSTKRWDGILVTTSAVNKKNACCCFADAAIYGRCNRGVSP